MIDMFLVIIWMLATLTVASAAGILGKRYGVIYPAGILASLVVIAGILASKIVVFGPFTVSAGVIVFSMTFLITDLISEKWGKREAQKAVWLGFYGNILLMLSVWIAIQWQPAPYAIEFSEMFAEVLGLAPRIAFAAMITYLVSQHLDVWSFNFLKKLTKGKHLWLRNNASTISSQLVDSTLFITIAFYGVFPVLPLILGQWMVKVIIALLDTPFIYAVSHLMDKIKPAK